MKYLQIALPTTLFIATLFSSALGAESVSPDKGSFHLLKPTPETLLRELTPDRPDKTESPYSVDAGRFQIEADFVNWTRDTAGGETATTVLFGNVLAKVGLNPSMDLQLGLSPITQSIVNQSTTTQFGDTTVRLKWNLTGNDGGEFALGLLPFITLPTAPGPHPITGGLSVPVAYALPLGFEGGAMGSLALGETTDLSTMITFGHDLFGPFGGYLEFFNTLQALKTENWVATLDAGVTYGIGNHLQLDLGANIGLTEAADDLNLFTGITARF